MKSLLLILFSLSIPCLAEEFRYQLLATTGLQEEIFDKDGKATSIVYSPESNSTARFLLSQITQLGGINGTASRTKLRGVPFNQALFLKGILKPKVFKTKPGSDLDTAYEYQQFVLESIQVEFPLSRIIEKTAVNPLFLETHFSFDSLFPDGLKHNGASIDFSNHTADGPPWEKSTPISLSIDQGGPSTAEINDELAKLFNVSVAAAMTPAEEGKIDDVDPFWKQKTFGMIFDPDETFSLQDKSLEMAFRLAHIQDWTFGMYHPWTPGEKTSWVIQDPFGKPFLSITLIDNQPDLIRIKQLTSFAKGQATLGRTLHRYFRCELTSKDFAQFLRTTAKERASEKFTPVSLTNDEDDKLEDR